MCVVPFSKYAILPCKVAVVFQAVALSPTADPSLTSKRLHLSGCYGAHGLAGTPIGAVKILLNGSIRRVFSFLEAAL
jgi:hypothetical protein